MRLEPDMLLLVIALAVVAIGFADALGFVGGQRMAWILAAGWINYYVARRLLRRP